jgi:hypothetical protein
VLLGRTFRQGGCFSPLAGLKHSEGVLKTAFAIRAAKNGPAGRTACGVDSRLQN